MLFWFIAAQPRPPSVMVYTHFYVLDLNFFSFKLKSVLVTFSIKVMSVVGHDPSINTYSHSNPSCTPALPALISSSSSSDWLPIDFRSSALLWEPTHLATITLQSTVKCNRSPTISPCRQSHGLTTSQNHNTHTQYSECPIAPCTVYIQTNNFHLHFIHCACPKRTWICSSAIY